ncbi:unannotated protein [freshwater metagenome]|uniref:Unannotated protein n=1 Tax=freshwater metagenome TaxID=449393 RepID=A0A6J6JQF3_9ZZZZ
MKRSVGLIEGKFEPVGKRPPLLAGLLGVFENLVIDIGDVANQGNVRAVHGEPTAELVIDQSRTEVTDVGQALNGWAAKIDSDLAGNDRFEGAHGLGA